MDFNKARKLLKKINTLLDSFESLDETISPIEAELLSKYADQFKELIPHLDEEPVKPAKVSQSSKKETQVIANPSLDDEFDVPPVQEESVDHEMEHLFNESEEEIATASRNESVEKEILEEVVLGSKEVVSTAKLKGQSVQAKATRKPLVATEEESGQEVDLWTPVEIKELSQKLSFSPIKNIFKAISINERIFTQKELFGGDNSLFKSTLEHLETCSNFDEAVKYLRSGIAKEMNWEHPSHVKKANQFMNLVQRRFL